VRRCITSGKVLVEGDRELSATAKVRAGQLLELRADAPRVHGSGAQAAGGRRARLDASALVHVDSQVVVVEKPAGIATVPFADAERDTLDVLVAGLVSRGGRPRPLHVVHRLDKETSGLLVFARTMQALRLLKNQFRVHSVQRRYFALAHGAVASKTLRSRLVVDRGDGRRGSTTHPRLGREAITHVELIEQFRGAGGVPVASLVACRLETGRTHQIRIHLAEAGHPLLGERVYGKGTSGPLLPAPRVMLHAAELGFVHPSSSEHMFFRSELPADFRQELERLRGSGPIKPSSAGRRSPGPSPTRR
jgi:23S rRNA pseudouridine1911/1915/1917 synthase